MYELRRVLNRATESELQGLSKLLEIESSSRDAIIDSLRWHSHTLLGHLGHYVGSEPSYRDIVCQVADKLGLSHGSHQSVKEIEIEIAKKVMKTVWEKMTPEQRRQMEMEWQKTAKQFDKTGAFAGSASIFAAFMAANLSGFSVYLLATTGLGALTGVLGIALPFAAYTAMTSAIAVIIGPVGWIGAGLFALWALTGPNYKKLIPAILYICALRSQQ